jgi:hypothetical protein
VRRTAIALVALALTGCSTSAEKSAKLERQAKLLAAHAPPPPQGLSITRESSNVKVLHASVLSSSEGSAVSVTLRNVSSHALLSVPIAITVKDAGGRTIFQNNAPGIEAALTSIASLAAHREATWVDDQIPPSPQPASVSVRVGEASAPGRPLPRIEIEGLHSSEESASQAAGTVSNRSNVAQRELIVYVLARRAGEVVAAGRAVLPEVAPGASAQFQVLFVGSANGASLLASAPPTTFG